MEPLTPGARIGHYEILSSLGAGGMGQVFLAQDARLGRKVALKLLPSGLAADDSARQRFVQEARTASALNHPHIVGVRDSAREAAHDFIGMGSVAGETLRTLLGGGALEPKRALNLVAQAAS